MNPLLTCAIGLSLAIGSGAALAQDAPPAAPPGRVTATLDLMAVLRAPELMARTLEDEVWRLDAAPGRQFVQVPVRLAPADGPVEIGGEIVTVRGGRFIAFNLEPMVAAHTEAGPDPILDAVPPGAPLFTRKMTITPAAHPLASPTVTWKLDRFLPNGTVKEVDLDYALKLDPRRLEALLPQASPPPTRNAGEDMRDYQRRRREHEIAQRDAQRAFADRRRAVAELSDTFTAPLPEDRTIFAVYEAPEVFNDLTIGGLSEREWSVEIAAMQSARQLAGGGAAHAATDPRATAAALQRLVDSRHPFSQRLAAYAVNQADLARTATPGDPVERLLRSLLAADDRETRLTALSEISSTVPPTTVTVGLIRDTAAQFDPTMQLVSLRGLLAGGANEPEQLASLVKTANQMLADPNGAPPGQIVASILEQATLMPQMEAMRQGIDFDTTPPARRQALIRGVARAAPHHPLAAHWLNFKLLGSGDRALVKQTVQELAEAKVNVAPAADAQGAGVSGSPAQPGPTASQRILGALWGRGGEAPEATQTPAQSPAAADLASIESDADDFVLDAYIPLDSTDHSLFGAINDSDATIREPAWRALGAFSLPDQAPADPTDPMRDPYALLISSALAQPPAPASLVPFLERQSDRQRVAAALMRLVVEDRGEAGTAAAKALMGSGLPLAEVLQALAPEQRHAFGKAIYRAVDDREPIVTGVLRWTQPQNPVVAWFAEKVSQGALPAASAWFNAVGNEDQVLLLALSTDPELARAGAAALAHSVGGDEQQAEQLAATFDLITTRTADGARPEWQLARRKILADRLRAAAGEYRLKLVLYARPDPAAPPPPPDAPPGSPVETLDLGVIKLEPEGDGLVMAAKTMTLGAAPDAYAIRVERLAELTNFPGERLGKLPVAEVDPQTLDLHPADGDLKAGSWYGGFTLPTLQRAALVLEPVD